MSFAAFIRAGGTDAKGGDFDQNANKEVLAREFEIFCEPMRKAIEYAAEDLKVWTLPDTDALRTWHTGKLVLIGDAAHPFLSFPVQGAAMAMEDSASLAALLPEGTNGGEAFDRLKLYEEHRYARATGIQHQSRKNGADPNERDPNFDPNAALEAAQMHDEWAASK